MVYTLTLDGGLLRERQLSPSIRALKAWEAEGKVVLFESDRAKEPSSGSEGWPGAKPAPRPRRPYRPTRKAESGGVTFNGICSVIFPMRDSNRLTIDETNDVAHLLRHHSLGHSIFVTQNEKNFISDGRRDRLRTAFKIVVLTPDETVQALSSSEGWSAKAL